MVRKNGGGSNVKVFREGKAGNSLERVILAVKKAEYFRQKHKYLPSLRNVKKA